MLSLIHQVPVETKELACRPSNDDGDGYWMCNPPQWMTQIGLRRDDLRMALADAPETSCGTAGGKQWMPSVEVPEQIRIVGPNTSRTEYAHDSKNRPPYGSMDRVKWYLWRALANLGNSDCNQAAQKEYTYADLSTELKHVILDSHSQLRYGVSLPHILSFSLPTTLTTYTFVYIHTLSMLPLGRDDHGRLVSLNFLCDKNDKPWQVGLCFLV